MANPPKQEPVAGGFFRSLTGGQNQQKLLEQTVVTWQDDESVTQCPFCEYPPFRIIAHLSQLFNFSNRKHHCRLCGRVVCGNPLTNCSTSVGLNVSGGRIPRTTAKL
jgi:rabenosyn-5